MASRKRPARLRPKTPARVRKRKRPAKGARGHQHPELGGLGLAALGIFLGSVVYAGWNGGYVGAAMADGLDAPIGGAPWGIPVAFVAAGGLMVTRSALVEFRPFRTGVVVVSFGLMLALGRDQGGYLGQLLGGAVGVAIGATGSTILGVLLLLVGGLLLSGASLGAVLRRSHHQVRSRVADRRRRAPAIETWNEEPVSRPAARRKPVVDAESAYPDVVEPAALAP